MYADRCEGSIMHVEREVIRVSNLSTALINGKAVAIKC